MGRNEDVGPGRPSISTGTGPDSEPATPALISPPTFLGEPARADQWDEHDGTVGRLSPVIAVADDECQHLVIAGPDRDDEASPIRQLSAQLVRDRRRSRGHDDAVPWATFGVDE